MKALIVAGGRGERLRPLTNTIPKPMIKVSGKPVLEYVINLFKKYDINDLVVALCYLPHTITDYFGDGSRFGVHIDYTYEPENAPMGTAGAIVQAERLISGTFIVTYADILRKLDIEDIVNFHHHNAALATINVYKNKGLDPKSQVMFAEDKKIRAFVERPAPDDIKKDSVWSNGSFYVFEPEIFKFIPKDTPTDFGKDVFPRLLALEKRVFAYPSNGYFIDVGNLEKLEKARATFKS